MNEPAQLWDSKRIGATFARIAKDDGTIGAEEIMLVISGMIGEYELDRAALTARIAELEAQLAQPPVAMGVEELVKRQGDYNNDQ